MDAKKDQMTNVQQTAPWLKKTLILLLILSALAGFGLNAWFFIFSGPCLLKEQLNGMPFSGTAKTRIEEIQNLTQQKLGTDSAPNTIDFQGTLLGETGAIAIINDEMAAVGAELNGVRLLQITNRTIVIEFEGQTHTLSIGQSFTPGR